MVVIIVMILTMNKKYLIFLISIYFFLNSCDAIKDYTGFSKPKIDDSTYISQVPDLVLPPDFGKEATVSSTRKNNIKKQNFDMTTVQNFGTVTPNIPNFEAQRILSASPTPSDSLEKFKNNKKFTIGEWVYQQYVEGFKKGNIYYRPIYDRGYNFSRRYMPNQNRFSNFGLQSQNDSYQSDSFSGTLNGSNNLSPDLIPVIE